MKRLNPIYILALVATLFIVSIFSLKSIKNEYSSLNKEFNSYKIKVEDFNEYKNTWFSEKRILKKIDTILRSSLFKREKVLRTQNNGVVKVKIESVNPVVLNKFLNRFLNENFLIKKLDIKKSSISLEIGLK